MKFTPKPTALPPPLLDVGEGWAAVIGLKAVLSKRVEQITEAQFTEAAKIHETIERRAKALVNGTFVPRQVAIVDYPKVLEQTSGDIDEAQIVAMMSALPPNDQGPYLAVAQREFKAVQSVIPKLTFSSLAGDQAMTPDLTALTEFSDFFAMLDDPLATPFGMMANGTLTRDHSEAFKLVFPSLSEAIGSAIDDEIAQRVAKRAGFVLPWKVELGIEAWRGLPPDVPILSPPPPPAEEDQEPAGEKDTTALTPSERLESA